MAAGVSVQDRSEDLFKTLSVSAEQQARNRRDIETLMESTVGEVVDSFIPWREISRAYFHAKSEAPAPAPAPVVAPPPVKFEEKPQVHEFETDEEEEEDDVSDESHEERPKIALGEDIALSDDEGDAASVNTEDELERRAESSTIALNL